MPLSYPTTPHLRRPDGPVDGAPVTTDRADVFLALLDVFDALGGRLVDDLLDFFDVGFEFLLDVVLADRLVE